MKLSENKSSDVTFEKVIVRHLVKDDLRSKYASELKEQHATVRTEPKIIKFNHLVWKAAILLLVSGSFLFVTQLRSNNPHQIAMSLAKETTILGNQDIMRKDEGMNLKLRLEANKAFVGQKYDEAIQNYVKLEATGDLKEIDYFYLGVSYLKSDNSQAVMALKAFDQLKADSRIVHEIKWFKALAMTIDGNLVGAKILLQEIIAENGYKAPEAKILLSKF